MASLNSFWISSDFFFRYTFQKIFCNFHGNSSCRFHFSIFSEYRHPPPFPDSFDFSWDFSETPSGVPPVICPGIPTLFFLENSTGFPSMMPSRIFSMIHSSRTIALISARILWGIPLRYSDELLFSFFQVWLPPGILPDFYGHSVMDCFQNFYRNSSRDSFIALSQVLCRDSSTDSFRGSFKDSSWDFIMDFSQDCFRNPFAILSGTYSSQYLFMDFFRDFSIDSTQICLIFKNSFKKLFWNYFNDFSRNPFKNPRFLLAFLPWVFYESLQDSLLRFLYRDYFRDSFRDLWWDSSWKTNLYIKVSNCKTP